MSHTVLIEFTCNEGSGAEFLTALLAALPDTRAFDGCESVETYTDTDNPDVVLLWEKWAARSNQEAYLGWRMETGLLDAIGPFLASPPRIAHLSPQD